MDIYIPNNHSTTCVHTNITMKCTGHPRTTTTGENHQSREPFSRPRSAHPKNYIKPRPRSRLPHTMEPTPIPSANRLYLDHQQDTRPDVVASRGLPRHRMLHARTIVYSRLTRRRFMQHSIRRDTHICQRFHIAWHRHRRVLHKKRRLHRGTTNTTKYELNRKPPKSSQKTPTYNFFLFITSLTPPPRLQKTNMSSKWPNNYTILTSQLLTKPSNLSRISHTAPPGVRDRHRYYEHWHAHGRWSQRLSRKNTRQRQQQQRRKHDRRRAPASQPKIQAKRQSACARVLPAEQRSPRWWTTMRRLG